jgi:hypothetical protein
MKKFIIERNFPGASNLSAEEIQVISQTSCDVVNNLGKSYTWVQSFITGDKIYCVHIAENEKLIREHSRLAKLPVNIISEVKAIIDPSYCNPLSAA